MNPKLARLLTRLYPRRWRERYGAEFEALLEAGRGGLHTSANVAWSAICERIVPSKKLTMDQSLRSSLFNAWCVRAPWAMFGLAPVLLLAGAYLVACLILWLGWKAFLPAADTPFGRHQIDEFANLYFQFGKFLYSSAPILAGWAITVVAVRQRTKSAWPILGFFILAWTGAAARIQASRTAVPSGLGHIAMSFAFWPSRDGVQDGLFHAGVILSLTVLPYLFLRMRRARPLFS